MSNEMSREILDLIETVFEAFNDKDLSLMSSVYGEDVVIVDGFAPFRWTGPSALKDWWSDAEMWAQKGGVSKEHLADDGIQAFGISGDRSYASISAVLTITLNNGQEIIRPGILTYTFAPTGEGWKAEGHTWGRLS